MAQSRQISPKRDRSKRNGLCSRVTKLDKAKKFAKEHHVEKAYGCFEELLQDKNVDIVYIATPPHSNHYEFLQHKHL
ncbi:Gfo/Idh/MocA family oxidoreductase [Bacillus mojavensis]|nr:Gfo/Idh/MocA family oxidoreductase [Bacillus mojavensis]